MTNDRQALAYINANDMAYPVENVEHTPNNTVQLGLTKREYIATKVMQSFCVSTDNDDEPSTWDFGSLAQTAVKAADALLTALTETP